MRTRATNIGLHGSRHQSGFTLIEIIVVMVIITVIIGTSTIAFRSEGSPTEMKQTALNLYQNLTYLQEESLLTGDMFGVSINEVMGEDTEVGEQASAYDVTWFQWVVEDVSGTNDEADSDDESSANDTSTVSVFASTQTRQLKKRYWKALPETVVPALRIPAYFNAFIELDGERRSFSDLAQVSEQQKTRFEQAAELAMQKNREMNEDDDELELEEDGATPIIHFFPDGFITDFRLVLQNKDDESQGFLIRSVNEQRLVFGFLGDEDV
ncbi:MAG: prepilin-type N-terminal cleavage/methylation domain-containing protein [Pseudomonadota bacterium]